LKAIEGDKYERLFKLDLFSGLRQSEILGLEWQDVDFENGLIHVCRQLQRNYETNQYIFLDETKNGKDRIVAIAPSIVAVLREQKRQQAMWQLSAGDAWDNPNNLIFTDTLGGHLKHFDVYRHFKKIVASIGMPNCRFHDLRHSYAINALQCGDNPKVVSEQLGHYSTAFTMDVYGSVSETMRKDSQDRMENYILKISKG
jgi:integrase